MNADIALTPHEVWDYFQENKDDLGDKLVCAAESEDTGCSVCLTCDNGKLVIVLMVGNEVETEHPVCTEEYCRSVITWLYQKYIYDCDDDPMDKNDGYLGCDDEDVSDEDLIYMRNDELYVAMKDFLSVALERDYNSIESTYGDEFVPNVLMDFLTYLSEDQGLSVYMPTFMEDTDGGRVLVEYPFDVE